MIGCW